MRVHILALGSHGDVLPLVALGAELRRRGHAVDLGAPPPFASIAARAGLAFHPIGTRDDHDRVYAHPDLWHPRRGVTIGLAYYLAMTEPAYRWLAEVARPGESVTVASPLGLGARVAQDRLALPLVTVHVMPVMVESRHAPPVLPGMPLARLLPRAAAYWITRGADVAVVDPAVLPGLNAFRAGLGLPPVRRLRHWWNSPNRVVMMFPAWYAPPQPDWPPQSVQVGFPVADHLGDADDLTPELAGFLAAGEPPLVFTYGSNMRRAGPFFATAARVCAAMGRRGILLSPQEGQVPPGLPEGVVRAGYAPLGRLLPRCAALIHHGGVGTVARALAAGVPQIIVPTAVDHFDEARRVEGLGAGASLSRWGFTPARGARVLARLLADPGVAAACARVRTLMAGDDGTAAAGDAVETLLSDLAPR